MVGEDELHLDPVPDRPEPEPLGEGEDGSTGATTDVEGRGEVDVKRGEPLLRSADLPREDPAPDTTAPVPGVDRTAEHRPRRGDPGRDVDDDAVGLHMSIRIDAHDRVPIDDEPFGGQRAVEVRCGGTGTRIVEGGGSDRDRVHAHQVVTRSRTEDDAAHG
ncbi:hypothetical protein N8D74_05560 [Curtobacterium flaccumfaciens]|uniref:Uncharacterized protein n=1 Tax=Curtobacterium poinsettiae TaxID=159612 RepID=A0A9Q9P9Y7_9MICO|nr:hypothetical protein [Curtobacterium flaccumfaciens]UXN26349.1 hypothetical protein N8D74_05560 [Curtobacterium flaccumfaciens]UYC81191.1 hypothetical protein OE229_01640 [Curtobacterium flaccumfaciens pv. poinsettiae]